MKKLFYLFIYFNLSFLMAKAFSQSPQLTVRVTPVNLPFSSELTESVIWLSTETTEDTRHHLGFQIQLPSALRSRFIKAELATEMPDSLSLTAVPNSTGLSVSVLDNGTGTPVPAYSETRWLALKFQPLPVGQYTLSMNNWITTSLNNTNLGWNVNAENVNVVVGAPSITSGPTLPTAYKGKNYLHNLEGLHLPSPATWEKISGQFPAGIQLSSIGYLHGKPSQTGTFNFVVRTRDLFGHYVTKSLSITVATQGPKLRSALFKDMDQSGTVSYQDQIHLDFDGPVVLGTQAFQSLVPSVAEDSFGEGASLAPGTSSDEAILTLGEAPEFTQFQDSSGVQVIANVSQGITNALGVPAIATDVPLREFFFESDLNHFVVGQAIPPQNLRQNIFANDLAFDLPQGLSYMGGTLSGVPQQVGAGISYFSTYTTGEQPWRQKFWRILPHAPLPLYIDTFPSQQSFYPGSVIEVPVVANNDQIPVEVRIGQIPLVPLESSLSISHLYLIPDHAVSGQLAVSQAGSAPYFSEQVTIIPHPAPASTPTLESFFVYSTPSAQVGHLWIGGSGFYSPSVTIEGVPVNVIRSGTYHIIVDLPQAAVGEGEMEIVVTNAPPPESGGGQGPGQGSGSKKTPKVEPDPKNIPKSPPSSAKDQKDAFDAIMKKVNKETGIPKPDPGNGALWGIGAIESNFNECKQTGGGPARGKFQMEANSFYDAYRELCKSDSPGLKLCCAKIKEALDKAHPGTPPDSPSGSELVGDEAKKNEKSEDNIWPEGSVAEKLLCDSDYFAALMARCSIRRDPTPLSESLSDVNSNNYIEVAVDAWWANWKKKAGKDQTESSQKEKATKRLKAKMDALKKSKEKEKK